MRNRKRIWGVAQKVETLVDEVEAKDWVADIIEKEESDEDENEDED